MKAKIEKIRAVRTLLMIDNVEKQEGNTPSDSQERSMKEEIESTKIRYLISEIFNFSPGG